MMEGEHDAPDPKMTMIVWERDPRTGILMPKVTEQGASAMKALIVYKRDPRTSKLVPVITREGLARLALQEERREEEEARRELERALELEEEELFMGEKETPNDDDDVTHVPQNPVQRDELMF